MRILVLGNNYAKESLVNYFKQNEENIVFSNSNELIKSVDFSNPDDIADFCEANEINFVIPAGNEFISAELEEKFNDLNITYFAPAEDAADICKYKSYAKRFMYKNKIESPKFFIAEKTQAAIEYLKTTFFPVAIHPEIKSYTECVKFAETYGQAQKYINEFFMTGNKKLVIEDYVDGKNIIFWAISDGYSAKIIGASANYMDCVSVFEPEFITEDIKQSVIEKIINPTILNLSLEGDEYIGIIGFDTILTRNNDICPIGYKSFFDDLSIDFFLNGFSVDWLDIFESCIKGDVLSKYDFCPNDDYMISLRDNENVEFISAKTKANLKRYIDELDINTENYDKAVKLWKYWQ